MEGVISFFLTDRCDFRRCISNSILVYSILVYSILIYSILIYSILIYSILIYSILIYKANTRAGLKFRASLLAFFVQSRTNPRTQMHYMRKNHKNCCQ